MKQKANRTKNNILFLFSIFLLVTVTLGVVLFPFLAKKIYENENNAGSEKHIQYVKEKVNN